MIITQLVSLPNYGPTMDAIVCAWLRWSRITVHSAARRTSEWEKRKNRPNNRRVHCVAPYIDINHPKAAQRRRARHESLRPVPANARKNPKITRSAKEANTPPQRREHENDLDVYRCGIEEEEDEAKRIMRRMPSRTRRGRAGETHTSQVTSNK